MNQLDDFIFLKSLVSEGTIEEIQEILDVVPQELFNNNLHIEHLLVRAALKKKRIDVTHYLIDRGFQVYLNLKFQNIETLLHCAVELGDLSLINKMLRKGAISEIGYQNETGQTPVHLAIDTNQIAIMQLFLSTVDVVILNNQYLVHYAIEKSKPEIVKLLLHKGFSSTKKNKDNKTPFCIAIEKHELAILDSLWSSYDIQNFLSDDYANIALTYIASITGNIHFLKKSISTGFPINRPVQSCPGDWSVLRNCAGCTLFFLAVQYAQLKMVKFLMKNGADFTINNEKGISPLCVAVKAETNNAWKSQEQLENNKKIIEEILRASIKLNVDSSNESKMCFYVACMTDQPEILEYYLKNGAPVNESIKLTTFPSYGFSPLHLAAKYGHRKNVESLLECGGNVNQEGSKKITPLHVASNEASVEIVELLLRHGANIFNEDSSGNTPIHYAFMTKQYKNLDLLLSLPTIANSNPINDVGISHFHIACTRNNINTVESFIQNGVHVNTCVPMDTKITYPIADYNIKLHHMGNSDSIFPHLGLDCKPHNDIDWRGCSPLHFAVSFNRSKIVRMLLCNNANVEIKDAKGCTPLHLACQYTHNKFRELIQMSLKNVEDYQVSEAQCKAERSIESNPKNMKNENQFNESSKSMKIIDWSANRKEHIKLINLLIKCKSDVNCLDNFGNGALFYACHLNMNSILNTVETIFKNQISSSLNKELDTRRNLILNILSQANANPDNCYNHSSILHYICLNNTIMSDEKKIELAKLFLQNGANVNAKNETLQTPLHSAVEIMNERLVTLLLNYNADINSIDNEKRSPLYIATSHALCGQSAKIISILIEQNPNVNLKRLDGTTALHNLVSQSLSDYTNFETLMYNLVKKGADVNIQDLDGKTPLFMACAQQNEAVDSLIEGGADINVEDCRGHNVLYYIYKNQAKPLYVENQALDDKLISMLETLYNHLIKLTTIGLYVSDKILKYRSKLRIILRENLFDFLDEDEQQKIGECQDEIKKMKAIKIDSKNSLYDVIFKNETAMAKLIKNETLRNTMESPDFHKIFGIYSRILEAKCIKGFKRCLCMPYAKCSLKFLSGIHLPDICSENILKYLNYFELKDFIDCTVSVMNEETHSKSLMPSRVLRSSTKYQRVN